MLAKKQVFLLIFSFIMGFVLIGGGVYFVVSKATTNAFTPDNVDDNSIQIGELYAGNSTFSAGNTTELISRITGNQPLVLPQTAKDIRERNNNQSVIVKLGGLDWIVTYLSTDKNNNLIATLYLSDIAQVPVANRTSTFSYTENGTYGFNYPYQGVPTNMYGTSFIRAVSLNNGGNYINITSNEANPEYVDKTATQDRAHLYARYTMSNSVEYSGLANFIVTPADVSWQENGQKTREWTDWGINVSNQNWTDEKIGESADDKLGIGYNYANKYYATSASDTTSINQKLYGNSTWKNDKLWLPSMAETGFNETHIGLWDMDVDERSFFGSHYAWLRSAYHNDTYSIDSLGSLGTTYNATYGSYIIYGLRPALHFNITAAASAAGLGEIGATIRFDNIEDITTNKDKSMYLYKNYTGALPINSVEVLTHLTNKFGGYYTQPNGQGTQYYNADGTSTQNWTGENGEFTLYASWAVDVWYIRYDGNGATSGFVGMSTHRLNEPKPLYTNNYVRAHYTFAGWSRDKSAVVAEFSDGKEVTQADLGAVALQEVTLYAVWNRVDPYVTVAAEPTTGGSVIILENGNTPIEPVFSPNAEIKIFANPNIDFAFIGWVAEGIILTLEQQKSNPLLLNVPNNDIKITAMFTSDLTKGVGVVSTLGGLAYVVGDNFVTTPPEKVVLVTKQIIEGYKFAGWKIRDEYLKDNGVNILDLSVSIDFIKVKDKLVTAVWVPDAGTDGVNDITDNTE